MVAALQYHFTHDVQTLACLSIRLDEGAKPMA
jgi:hypothetical protein